MKVKGIESAHSGFWFLVDVWRLRDFLNKKQETRNKKQEARNRLIVTVLLLFALALPLPVTPSGRAAASQEEKPAATRLHREAKKELRKGQFQKAVEIYNQLLEIDPKDLQAKLGAAFAYLKIGDYQSCYNLAYEAAAAKPTSARAHAIAGLALLRSGYVSTAVVELRQALDYDNREAMAHGGAAEIDYYEGRTRDARVKSLQAHNLDPQEPDYLVTYARASSRDEDFKEAADAYELFLRIAPLTDRERRQRIEGLIKFYRQLSGMKVHQIGGPATTEIPFELGNDRRPYMKIKINGRDATFVIDTGSGFTVISSEAAKRLGVKELARGGNSQGVGGDGKFPIVYGMMKSMQLNDVKVRIIPCFIRPFHGIEGRPNHERADGLIGLSVLSHFLTELDYKEGKLKLDRNTARPLLADAGSEHTTVVPFRTTQNGLISIETELDSNHTINAILDSAASSTVISTAAVERLNLRDQIIKGQTANVIGAAGIARDVELLFIRKCRVANLQQNNLRALVLNFTAINETSGFEQSGILGGDFMRHFSITIDFTRAQVAFKPHTSAITKQ